VVVAIALGLVVYQAMSGTGGTTGPGGNTATTSATPAAVQPLLSEASEQRRRGQLVDALATLARARAQAPESDAVRQLQEGVAMEGIRDVRVESGTSTFTDAIKPALTVIDAALAWSFASSAAADEAYLRALELGSAPLPGLAWQPSSNTELFMGLCQRLRHAGVDRFRVDAEQVTADLGRILARRPRLALAEQETPAVKAWAAQAFLVVKTELPALLEQLKNRLDGQIA
jgi:hypothetical protein